MILKNKLLWLFVVILLGMASCGVYSFTGAVIEGKTINIHFIENNARTVAPSLSSVFTEKLRQRVLSQTSLAQVNSETTDYDLNGQITAYDVSVAAITGDQTSSKNRLTITVNIEFENRKNEKANFTQAFTRFADFNSDQNIQSVETQLINTISDQLADDIFNKAFVNW